MWLRIGKWASYLLFFVAVFIIAIYATFPNSALQTFLQARIEKVLFPAGAPIGSPGSVKIGEASLWRLSGADMSDVVIQESSQDASKAPKWKFDRVKVRLGLWSLLFGGTRVEFKSDLYVGSASGAFNFSNGQHLSDFWVEVEDLDLSKMNALAKKVGVPLRGIASLSMVFDAGNNPAQDATGNVDFTVNNFGMGDGNLKIMGFALPVAAAKLGKLEAKIDILKGNAKSKLMRFVGGDIETDMNFALKLDKDFMRSRTESSGWVKFGDAYLEKASSVRSSLSLAESYKQTDGKYYFKMSGPLSYPMPTFVAKGALEQKGPTK